MRIYGILFLCLLIFSGCKNKEEKEVSPEEMRMEIEVYGHRGDRGNFPENTIPAFISAVRKGVDVLELDVVISKDKQVVVSHEPYMSSLFMSTPAGDSIRKEEEQTFNLYQMSYDSIRQFDAGSRGNRLFPNQQKMKTYKPLLSEVIDSVQNIIEKERLKQVKYSIELKSSPSQYGKSQPYPEEFIELVMYVVREKNIQNITIMQSFDPKILNICNSNHPYIVAAYLVEEGGITENLSLLDFTPGIYSPHYRLVQNKQIVDSVKSMGMELVPWTINTEQDIENAIRLRVDGIITDFPERVIQKLNNGK